MSFFSRCCLVLALCGAAANAQTTPKVSVGLFPFLVGNMDGQINQIVARAVADDVDTLYVSVFRARGPRLGELWITDRANWNTGWGSVRPTGAGIDLVALIQAAHAQNINVVGVIKCFDSTVQPTDLNHRQYLLDVIDYLVRSYNSDGTPVYDLDGIALDYIRFVSNGTGNSPFWVTSFVEEIRQRVGLLSLHAYLIANRFTFDGPVYNGNFNSYASAMATLRSDYGQDWEALSRSLDVLMPMAYTADGGIYNTYAGHHDYVRQVASYANTALTRGGHPERSVVPVVKTYSGSGESTTPQTIDASIAGALAGGSDGYQSFRYATMYAQPSWAAAFAAYATPGANSPIARLSTSTSALTATLDPMGSTDPDEPTAQLDVRFDFDDDGEADTAWMPASAVQALLPTDAGQRFGVQVRDSTGNIAATTRYVPGFTSLAVASSFYSASQGGSLDVVINAGPAAAGLQYLMLVSLSGSSPGFDWEGYRVPLNFDGMTAGFLTSVNTPVLTNGLGFCDAQGRATGTFWLPPGLLSTFAFQQMTWAAIAVDPPTNAPRFVTNSAQTLIIP